MKEESGGGGGGGGHGLGFEEEVGVIEELRAGGGGGGHFGGELGSDCWRFSATTFGGKTESED